MPKQTFIRHFGSSQLARQTGLTVLELLVVMSIIGVLAGLLLPALGAAREAARRVQCTSHLRQIGLALHSHHDASGALPVGWTFDPNTQSAYGWAVSLLPYLESSALFDRIDGQQRVSSTVHEVVRATSLSIMLCPSDITEPTFVLYEDDEHLLSSMSMPKVFDSSMTNALVQLPTANYVAMFGTIEPDDSIPAPIGDGAFLENKPTRFRDFARGLSHTIAVGERTMAQVPSTWFGVELAGEDAAARLVGSALEGINNPLADECDYSSRHPGGANFLWGDGHVSFITEQVDLHLYHQSSRLRD
jgi:prepilin-type processing-associated H-X9-DG protein/prepilin-type N-terminal cleavage/methylation domain-containing protein